MTDRNPPTIINTPGDLTGEAYAAAIHSAVQALWDRVPCWLDIDSGTNALVASTVNAFEEAPTALVAGQEYKWIALNTNTAAVTIAIDGLTAVDLVARDGAALAAGDHVAGTLYKGIYDGADMRLLQPADDIIAARNVALFGFGQASGTDGGATVANAWTRYPLNDEVYNDIDGASLDVTTNVGRFTLPAGRYEIDARAVMVRSQEAQLRIYNVTAGAFVTAAHSDSGQSSGSGVDAGKPSVFGIIDISSAADFEIRYEVTLANAQGLGSAMTPQDSLDEEFGLCIVRQYQAIDAEPVAKVYTVGTVPAAGDNLGKIIYVSDEVGGATLAFSDGTNWLRVQDRTAIST